MRRYCIENLDSGEYFLAGEWAEEPEWFDRAEADAIVRSHPLISATSSTVAVRAHDFGAEDME